MVWTDVLDWKLLEAAQPALEKGEKVRAEFSIKNTNRTTGTILSNEISKRYKAAGLPDDTIHFKFNGTAGQSFGAFNTKGVTLELEGGANDYFGKGSQRCEADCLSFQKSKLYTGRKYHHWQRGFLWSNRRRSLHQGKSRRTFLCAQFRSECSGGRCRRSWLRIHDRRYMLSYLGTTGRNFAAGMSGGIAYIYDTASEFAGMCNMEMVNLETLTDDEDTGCYESMIKSIITIPEVPLPVLCSVILKTSCHIL